MRLIRYNSDIEKEDIFYHVLMPHHAYEMSVLSYQSQTGIKEPDIYSNEINEFIHSKQQWLNEEVFIEDSNFKGLIAFDKDEKALGYILWKEEKDNEVEITEVFQLPGELYVGSQLLKYFVEFISYDQETIKLLVLENNLRVYKKLGFELCNSSNLSDENCFKMRTTQQHLRAIIDS